MLQKLFNHAEEYGLDATIKFVDNGVILGGTLTREVGNKSIEITSGIIVKTLNSEHQLNLAISALVEHLLEKFNSENIREVEY